MCHLVGPIGYKISRCSIDTGFWKNPKPENLLREIQHSCAFGATRKNTLQSASCKFIFRQEGRRSRLLSFLKFGECALLLRPFCLTEVQHIFHWIDTTWLDMQDKYHNLPTGQKVKKCCSAFFAIGKIMLKELPEKENGKIQVLLTSRCTNVNIHQNNPMPFFSFI